MISKRPEPNFDRVAWIYRWGEYLALGPLLQRTRTHLLTELLSSTSALVMGDGDGRFLAKLLAANRYLHALAVDSSTRMLALLGKRCAFAGTRLHTLQAPAQTIVPASHTDLVVTHFFLDCLSKSEVEALVRNVAEHCEPGTLWLVSDFQIPSGKLMKLFAAAYIRALYSAFRLMTNLQVQQLPEHRTVFEQSGFTRVLYHTKLGGMLYTELWELNQKR